MQRWSRAVMAAGLLLPSQCGLGDGEDGGGAGEGSEARLPSPPERITIENKRMRNAATSLCLAAAGRSDEEASVEAASCSNVSPHVRWDVAEGTPSTSPPRYVLRPRSDPSLCLTYLPDGLSLRACAEEPGAAERQLFRVTASGDDHEISDASGDLVLTAIQPDDVAMLPRGELSPDLQRWMFY